MEANGVGIDIRVHTAEDDLSLSELFPGSLRHFCVCPEPKAVPLVLGEGGTWPLKQEPREKEIADKDGQ
ncbi:MAG: hypothetical protein OHK0012_18640 [Synechococcales cyanobacterium]